MLIPIKDRQDLEKMLDGGEERQLLLVTSPDCPACRMSKPEAEKFAAAHPLYTADATESPSLLRLLSVRSVPTLLVFSGRREVMRRTGVFKEATLQALYAPSPSGKL